MCPTMCIYDFPGGGRYPAASCSARTPRRLFPGAGAADAERKCMGLENCAKSAASPCRDCCLVAEPARCENKNCRLWQRWFIDSWNALRRPWEAAEDVGADPCLSCLCPRDLCRTPCGPRRAWEVSQ